MTEKVHQPTYSSIMSSEEFNYCMTFEHRYIGREEGSDALIEHLVTEEIERHITDIENSNKKIEAVELGCGPARLLQRIAMVKNLRVTGIDHDPVFIKDGGKILREKSVHADMLVADMATYTHLRLVDVFYSQGVHHHIEKGAQTTAYLMNVRRQMNPGGVFIVSDEFLPEYKTSDERKIRTVIWHSHIIAHALADGYARLAEEEAKTVLDDLNENEDKDALKSIEQIETVLGAATKINDFAERGLLIEAEYFSQELLDSLSKMRTTKKTGNPSVDLSRGDFKISASVFQKEVEAAGFRIEQSFGIGPVDSIGGFRIFVLKNNNIFL
jgi:SAM-dependent methyltransferase